MMSLPKKKKKKEEETEATEKSVTQFLLNISTSIDNYCIMAFGVVN
jgi:hypothetical protein